MKQLIQNTRTGELKLRDVPYPLCKSKGVVVKTANSLISIGTERSIIDFARKNLAGKATARPDLFRRAWEKARREGFLKVFRESLFRLDEPFPLGYSGSGVVVEVGEDVRGFNVGDKVAIGGSGYANHAEYNFVTEDLCFKIPKRNNEEYLDFEEAAFCMLGGIAMHSINEAELKPASYVAVIGLGLLGLITAQILTGLGYKVLGIDIDDNKVNMAKKLGCEHSINSKKEDAERWAMSLTGDKGVSAVLITAASKDSAPIELGQKIACQYARIVLVGVCDIHLNRKYFWDKELVFKVSKAGGASAAVRKNIEDFLDLIAEGRVNIKGLVTHRFAFEDAILAYRILLEDKSPSIGVIFDYLKKDSPLAKEARLIAREIEASRISKDKRKNIGLIGGGMFAKNILLPALSKIEDVNLVGIATARGITSEHIASKFDFDYSTTDYRKVLEDENIDTVFILTRHNLHSKFVIETLRHGKDVFVEKPLCLNKEELNSIIDTYGSPRHQVTTSPGHHVTRSPGHHVTRSQVLMVGFNRRYSPHAKDIKEFFDTGEPFVINCRINAGFIEPSHWTRDSEEGGGRIIGEVCHFVDLLQFITSSHPVRVHTEGISNSNRYNAGDNIISTIKFEDGSVANITYTAKGTRSYPREILEIYQSDSIYYLEDFCKATKIKANNKERKNLISQDMGYKGELEYFFSNKIKKEDFNDYVINSLTVFGMVESLNTGSIVEIEDFN